ncbi:MAG TPA: creatininase family protein [Candidatus Methylomirabilis sp.]|nr:creatininase family protein [Candidatus Methylomirabilis sp.]
MDASSEVMLPRLTRREFRDRMSSGELRACIVPVGATEQHLEHLAMEHDWRSCLHIATEVARQLTPAVLVAPAMSIGMSEHHMRHPGTLTALPGSWLSLLADVIRSVHAAGFLNILVLNGHAGNTAPSQGAWRQFLQRFEVNLHFRSYWEFLPPDLAATHLKTGRVPGHAQEFETAFALAAFPENVRLDAMREQPDQEPLSATADTGRYLIGAIVERVTQFVQGMIDGREKAERPAFF